MKKALKALHHSDWNRPRLQSILKAIQNKRILVLGDVGVDRYTYGTVERISPEAPVPIVAVTEEKLKLGLAANVADNVKALGGEPWLTGLVGSDRFAGDLSALLKKEGISDRHLVADSTRKTILKERIVSEGQQLLRVDYENLHAVEASIAGKIQDEVKKALPEVDAFIVEDYAKGLISKEMLAGFFEQAQRLKKPALVDPNSATPVESYRGAYALTPNKKEAEALSGIKIKDEPTLCEAGEAILRLTQAEYVVITRGREGMAIFQKGNIEALLIPTYAREVYDVSGAGDTVIAVLALALSVGASMTDACILSNLAAGVEVGKRGTATVSVAEVLQAMDSLAVGS
jgi:rfaE bifunctional protein kinase chain/domain